MSEPEPEYFIEFTAMVGPIGPPHALHTFVEGEPDDTVHGELAARLNDAVHEVAQDADTSAQVVTRDEMLRRGDRDLLLLDRLSEMVGRLLQAEVALGSDGPITADGLPEAIRAVVAERDRLRGLLTEIWEAAGPVVAGIDFTAPGGVMEGVPINWLADLERARRHVQQCDLTEGDT